ncbi:phenylpyruvate tautomerase MIF-related protein, partial [Kaarinaea lacus]
MPYLSIQTNQSLDESKTQQLVKKASHTVAEILGKPESYVMIAVQADTPM